MNFTHINLTLTYILIILVIFCILYLFYNGISLDNLIYYDNKPDNLSDILEILHKAKQKAQNKLIKERFVIDNRLLQEKDANLYYEKLNSLQSWIDNSLNSSDGIITRLKTDLENTNKLRNEKKDQLINDLANIYILSYINQLDKANAESYKVYLNFKTPEVNKYYQQYLQ